MSEENVEVVRRVYDAAARRDAETVRALYDPKIEWDWTRVSGLFGQGGLYRGREALQRRFQEWSDGLGQIHYEAEEVVAADDHVVTKANMRGRGRASGIEVASTLYAVWTIREDEIVQMVWFPTRAEASKPPGCRSRPRLIRPRSADVGDSVADVATPGPPSSCSWPVVAEVRVERSCELGLANPDQRGGRKHALQSAALHGKERFSTDARFSRKRGTCGVGTG